MKTRVVALLCLFMGAAFAACGDSSDDQPAATATSSAPSPTPTATALPGDAPMPERITFSPGQTIGADGKAGIFFLDPLTGDAEGWVVPASEAPDGGDLPFSFTLGGVSADGGRIVYTCLESSTSGLNPCGESMQQRWYLLDTSSGSRTRLDAFSGDFLSISPDGATLLGRTADGIALADVTRPGESRPIALPASAADDLAYARADWAPDASHVVLTGGERARWAVLIDGANANVIQLDAPTGEIHWSPDATRFTLGRRIDKSRSELVVFDRDGSEIWSKPVAAGGVAGVWSGDGAFLYAQEEESPATPDGFGPLYRIIILNADTGATAHRVRGALCPTGWAGRSHTLVMSSYDFPRQPVVDLDAGMLRLIDEYVTPVPFDDDLAILFDGSDFSSYSLSTGSTELIAATTVGPAWDPLHEPLFAGERLVFTALHGGYGGCGEGGAPQDPPPPELLTGPFADDAPVTRGGVH